MSNFDWFGLMRGITEMHVESLKFAGELAENEACSSQAVHQAMTSPAIQFADAPNIGRDGNGATVLGGNGDAPESLTPLPPSQESLALPDSPVSGNEGVGGTADRRSNRRPGLSANEPYLRNANHGGDDCREERSTSEWASEYQASPADPQSSRSECSLLQALNTGKGVGGCGKLPPGAEAAGTDAFEHGTITSPLRNEHSPDSQKFAGEQGLPQGTAKCGAATSPNSPAIHIDRFGDDRFTDNILRACRNLPQHGDDEEERDAAEESALIEASGYLDPASDRRFA